MKVSFSANAHSPTQSDILKIDIFAVDVDGAMLNPLYLYVPASRVNDANLKRAFAVAVPFAVIVPSELTVNVTPFIVVVAAVFLSKFLH